MEAEMNRIVIGIVGAAMMASAGTAFAAPAVREQAFVPGAGGARYVAMLSDRGQDVTAVCGDRAGVDAIFQPEAVSWNVAPAGKGHERVTEDVRGIERLVPVSVETCRVNAGDHFDHAVRQAMQQHAS
ncbi:hypothetical protein COA07_07860 [Sphingomonas adhaesiva]|uniref:Uncharacterized protein n=2 Tax=Sphingomonadaceae TaxID=41297 RepID=A0A2A4I9J2_9SPHN|nr:hypothetical protein COA07_07860 [Sphingomonas adhaesiva]